MTVAEETALLDIGDVTEFIRRAFSVFELHRDHDGQGVYSRVCHRAVKANLPESDDEGENEDDEPTESPLGLFNVVRKEREGEDPVERIVLSPSDKLWAMAGVRVMLSYCGQQQDVGKALELLGLEIEDSVVNNLQRYCIDQTLSVCVGEMPPDAVKSLQAALGLGGDQLAYVLDATREHSLHPMESAERRMMFKTLYMGQLLLKANERRYLTNIAYIGYMHFNKGRDALFLVHQDTGILDYERIFIAEGYPIDHIQLERAAMELFSRSCSNETKLFNINIGEVEVFSSFPCDIYHWVDDWYVPRPYGPCKTKLPYVLTSALNRFLSALTNEKETRRRPFWKEIGEFYSGPWADLVFERYAQTQWRLPRSKPVTFGPARMPTALHLIDERGMHHTAPIPVLVQRHVCNVSLSCHYHSMSQALQKTGIVVEISAQSFLKYERFDDLFNFEYMDPPLNPRLSLDSSPLQLPIKTATTLKLLLYIYIFTNPSNFERLPSLDFADREAEFEQYWSYFESKASELMNAIITPLTVQQLQYQQEQQEKKIRRQQREFMRLSAIQDMRSSTQSEEPNPQPQLQVEPKREQSDHTSSPQNLNEDPRPQSQNEESGPQSQNEESGPQSQNEKLGPQRQNEESEPQRRNEESEPESQDEESGAKSQNEESVRQNKNEEPVRQSQSDEPEQQYQNEEQSAQPQNEAPRSENGEAHKPIKQESEEPQSIPENNETSEKEPQPAAEETKSQSVSEAKSPQESSHARTPSVGKRSSLTTRRSSKKLKLR
ncbi:hypothetical protein TRICI_001579 [Trichomonascus ciferrii]|uniref:Uncharacterized protein n=1 Tax=Trichomonascus ciferrii TaxID=44093 RepID=A0A642V9R3_9ASCO|nr:hypothetical protein TRICI_001579 [Trichomonascus ciferrii]